MAWEHLSINRPHLVYLILGGFTSIFMLCSLFIKEKLYIGEATVATICGVIFGPHAANLINPMTWGNTDQITLEFSRIVLVVQCFAVGVELPKAYMERHWKSVIFLLVPIMTFGWLICSLFIWWMIEPLNWLESLVVAACITATDPVLASSVVGKGKFAKRVPKHLRDLLSAESGCNDGMAFPFIYLSLYLVKYHLDAREVVYHWFCYTILYECIFGAVYGVLIGYLGRHAIKFAERRGLIDRESFLVFYFVLALFCAGSGSLLGLDDLLVGFAAGVGFSNDGWFSEKTEESHVSNVIDLLINLAYFVYFGTIIPWDQFNTPELGMVPWRLVVISIFVIFFRRIPALMAFKPFIPDVRTWREALFAGHFGPIGVGAIFVAILARAELETGSTDPLAELPAPGSPHYDLIYLVWPIVCFLVISSILVHGSSIAVFTLGKRINTLTITLSYTQDNEKGPAWMSRLPRITSQSRSMSKMDSQSDFGDDEKLEIPPGQLPPIGIPKLHLRRQREEDAEKPSGSRSSSLKPLRRRKKRDRDSGERLGGPISQSAIAPTRRSDPVLGQEESGDTTLFDKSDEIPPESRSKRIDHQQSGSSSEREEVDEEPASRSRRGRRSRSEDLSVDIEAYEEGSKIVVEDVEGNVVETIDASEMTDGQKASAIEDARNKLARDTSGRFTKHKHEPHPKDEGEEIEEQIGDAIGDAIGQPSKSMRDRFDQWKGFGRKKEAEGMSGPSVAPERMRGPAHAYQFGNTIIVEDKDGEVIKTYTIPTDGNESRTEKQLRDGLRRMSTWVGLAPKAGSTSAQGGTNAQSKDGEASTSGQDNMNDEKAGPTSDSERRSSNAYVEEDDGLRLIISHADRYGLTGLHKSDGPRVALGSGQRLSTKDFIQQMRTLDPKSRIQEADESDGPKGFKKELRNAAGKEPSRDIATPSGRPDRPRVETSSSRLQVPRPTARTARGDSYVEKNDYFSPRRPKPAHLKSDRSSVTRDGDSEDDDDDDDEEEEVPNFNVRATVAKHSLGHTAADSRRRQLATIRSDSNEDDEVGETAAEKRRRLAALGIGNRSDDSESDSEEDEAPRVAQTAVQEPGTESSGNQAKQRIQWGGESGREKPKAKTFNEDIYAGDPIVKAARKMRGMFGKKDQTD